MKNEIGRKLTSLTIMAIMFAGGMAIGVPSFMPEAASDLTETSGMLSVSSTSIQGSAILEIVVNDPDISDTTTDINNGATVTISATGNTYDLVQAVNGKWYAYVVDDSTAQLMDADDNGMEYGFRCTTGLGTGGSATILASGVNVYAEALATSGTNTDRAGGCLDIDNMIASLDSTAGTTSRQLMSDAVLQNAPALSNHNDKSSTDSGYDLGQRLHNQNVSGYGSWPYIYTFELQSDNVIEYGSDSITVSFGNTDADAAIGLNNPTVAGDTQLHLWISDPGLNIDPTTADKWEFDLDQSSTVKFANNGTNASDLTLAEQAQLGCVTNCLLTVDSADTPPTQLSGYDDVVMTESGANTGVFESWDGTGASEITTITGVTADKFHTFKYAGNAADVVIAFNDATVSMDAPGSGDWEPGTQATITITDNDLNTNPTSAETLSVGNASSVIPTIKVGSPLTLGGGNNPDLQAGDTTAVGAGTVATPVVGAHLNCACNYGLTVYNTTDNSERLKIIHSSAGTGVGGTQHTITWINVTTGHTRADLVNLPGTIVLNYDVSGPATQLGSTAVSVFVTDSGDNGTDTASGEIDIVTTGNARAGVADIYDGTYGLVSQDVSEFDAFGSDGYGTVAANVGKKANTGSSYVTVAFKIEHAAGDMLSPTEEYAIAADFCNFDQNNGSLTHNCIYRLEAEETGPNTGVFEGAVEYLVLNNSTSNGAIGGEHDGNDHEVEGLLAGMNGDALIVVLMDSVSGSDSVRVVYNDTDATQSATKRGAQLETVTHTGTVDLDAGTYGAADMATITIVDADLNQDTSVRDTYQNSSTTFGVSITKSGSTVATEPFSSNMVIIETGADTGIFVGTFIVPDRKGSDMELTYFESKDAGGSAVSFFDTATIQSNSGSISLDKSVYPVPWIADDLRTGANAKTGQSEVGKVVAWITVEDADYTTDTLTTTTTTSAGTILVKLIEGTTTSTCFTAGSSSASSAAGNIVEELGPLSEVTFDSSSYEVSMTIQNTQDCGAVDKTPTSGDILQVEYVDTANDAGGTSTSYDSATFDLRTGSLSVDKDVYVLGSDMVITLTDPDLNVDSSSSESYAMSIIEWDSAADSSCLLNNTLCTGSPFTNNPSSLEETGSDTGVFQTVTTLPSSSIDGNTIKFGESVTLTYVDVGLSGEDDTEDAVLDVEAYFSISNFGALVELDKAVYNWTDTVYGTITSPDHNVNTAAEETIGTADLPIEVTTRAGKVCATSDKTYFAAESGIDTGVFDLEVQLTGYDKAVNSGTPAKSTSCGTTFDGGSLKTAGQTDGVSVSYEYNDSSVVVASASILWNIGEAGFDSSSASAGGSAVFTVVDADENINDEVINSFTVDVYSDSDNGGFKMTVNETDENTGVFEGTVFFTSTDATSGSNLRISEGDTVTAEYVDKSLPEPYTDTDTLTIAGTLTIGTAYPPLERAPAANARVVDAFGSSVAEVSVDQQVQIAADVSNGQSSEQDFAYLVQVQDESGVTVSLAWITGSLTGGQSMSPALSWTPSASGSYTATVFVWESVDNPTALSPTVSVTIDVV